MESITLLRLARNCELSDIKTCQEFTRLFYMASDLCQTSTCSTGCGKSNRVRRIEVHMHTLGVDMRMTIICVEDMELTLYL